MSSDTRVNIGHASWSRRMLGVRTIIVQFVEVWSTTARLVNKCVGSTGIPDDPNPNPNPNPKPTYQKLRKPRRIPLGGFSPNHSKPKTFFKAKTLPKKRIKKDLNKSQSPSPPSITVVLRLQIAIEICGDQFKAAPRPPHSRSPRGFFPLPFLALHLVTGDY